MPNSLPYAVFHSKRFAANLAYSSSCAPNSWERKKKNLRAFSRGFHWDWSQKSHICLLSLTGEIILEISLGLYQAVSQSFPRAVKNPSGTVDQHYWKSTESWDKGWGLMWFQSLQLRSTPKSPIILLKPKGVKIWKLKWSRWTIKEKAASWEFPEISVKTELLFFLATLCNRKFYTTLNLFFFFVFWGPHSWHIEVPRLGVESKV